MQSLLSDSQYLQQIITYYKKLDELIDLDAIAIYNMENQLNFYSVEYGKARNITDNGLPPSNNNYNQQESLAEQQNILNDQIPRHSINFNLYQDKLQPYTASKYPIINKNNNHAVGILVILQKLTYTNIKFIILNALKIYNLPAHTNLMSQFKLSNREKQVMFLFLNGLSSDEIAYVLSKIDNKHISKSAIDIIFTNQLRIKFNASSRENLYEKLIALGFYNMIPSNLMTYIKLTTDKIELY